MMEWLRNRAEDARASVKREIGKFKNKEFMEAVAAGCALVSLADGEITPAEKRKMIKFMEQSDELSVFDTADVIAAFNKSVSKFDFDFEIGKAEALKIIGRIRKTPEAARIMVRVCCLIGSADGTFDDKEKVVVVEICRGLGLPPKEFGLTA